MSLLPGAPAEGPHVHASSTSEGWLGEGGYDGEGMHCSGGLLPFTVQPTLEMSQQICRFDFHLPRPRGH